MEDKKDENNKNYANLTHFIPGRSHQQPIGGWRYLHGNTFCLGRSTDQMKSIKDASLELVAKSLVDEAKAVDEMFKDEPEEPEEDPL